MTDRFTKCMNVDRQNNLIDGVAEKKKTSTLRMKKPAPLQTGDYQFNLWSCFKPKTPLRKAF